MNRRDFIVKSGALLAGSITGLHLTPCTNMHTPQLPFPRYRGFNLLEKFSGTGPRRKFREEDFEIMVSWGFDFARIPMSYWQWSSPDAWFSIDEDVLEDIDEVVELGNQYNVHISLNLHRIPGYCINRRDLEPYDLFDDTTDNMQKALDGALYHWKLFAGRYKGIPSSRLSFDLINEPPTFDDTSRFIEVTRSLVKTIRDMDPDRLIVSNGVDIGRTPVFELADLGIVQSTRGYDPMSVSHYKATWVPENEFETFNPPTWPLQGDDGKHWNKAALKEKLIDTWKPLEAMGVPVHVGEWGCYNKTPHDVALRWMRDILSLWKDEGWGHALWNLRGNFGVLNSGRDDVAYENFKGHKLDRKMLELLKEF